MSAMRTVVSLLAVLLVTPLAAQQPPEAARVDSIFARFAGAATPGCAVGVSRGGTPILERAYGMADLEHGVAATPGTIYEAGSVSKQFTAAAVVLLALDGKLSLDDDVRQYIPELPDYGEPITIRQLINHTSGLRDWGAVAQIHGWPRTTRVHTHDHVLDIAKRQKALNYPPGQYYSYTNTGYNLLAILVERVAGMPFAEFTKQRLFQPLGLRDTQWRDDFARIVERRAIAYSPARDGTFRMDMPFENVHGNGGLLTTVGDLLRWTENLETGTLGGPTFLEEMHRRAVLDDGRTLTYASGLVISEYRGVQEVAHSGSTAGYRAYLARYPEQRLAVAVLCNAGNANATQLARRVAEVYLGDVVRSDAPPAGVRVPSPLLAALAGTYRNTRTHDPVRLVAEEGALRLEGAGALVPLSRTRFQYAGHSIVFDAPPRAGERTGFRRITPDGDTLRYEPVASFAPMPDELAVYEGTYTSDEAEATYTFETREGQLTMIDRYGRARPLRPLYPDAFDAGAWMLRFHRDDAGAITGLSAIAPRVWDLRFQKVK